MCGIVLALVIFTITALIGMHMYVVTLMNRYIQDGNLRYNDDYGWSTTTNNGSNNNNGIWGDFTTGWGTTNNN
ncbi:hypothetical protein PHLCEN_2v5965 [Hermanssonia centrifuga]|uniref:Uncharacterized protein n=1 Tax=Hermanssonia centrifuga TaxID=98765 RepID=A0A2R6P0W9_9APHY|nr:hypothetical protein PHLCEN_2v5965 [Hermanssonia centrifuga]